VALGLAIIFMVFTIVIIFLVQNVSNNFYKTKLQVIETKTDQFTKPFLVSAANIWIQAASQTVLSEGDFFNVNLNGPSNYFTITLKDQDTEEVITCKIESQAGMIYVDTSTGSKTISINIQSVMTSPDLPGFEDFEAGLVLEMED
jgi:hypothetical protein